MKSSWHCLGQGFPNLLVPRTHFCESSLTRTPLLSCVNFSPNCYKGIKMQNENKLCLIVVSFLPTHMNHMNGTDGFASHSFCFNNLSVNCTFRPSDWRSAVGNLRFFDPQVATFWGDKRRPFLGKGETKIFLNFLIAVVFLLLTVCLIFWNIG